MDSAISLITALYFLLPLAAIISIKSRKDKNPNLRNWIGYSVLIGWASVQLVGMASVYLMPWFWYSENSDPDEGVILVSLIMTLLVVLYIILIRSTRVKDINEPPST